MGRVIAVTNNKGGTLKTSITVSLSVLLANEGERVLIIDTDDQGDVFLSFGGNPDELVYTIYDTLLENEQIENAVQNVAENLDVLPSNDEMNVFDMEVLTNYRDFDKPYKMLDRMLNKVRDKYDYIMIDTPPNLGFITGNVLSTADDVLIPFQPEVYSMRSLVKTLNAIQGFKEEQNNKLNVLGVIPTLVDGRTNLHKDILKTAEEYCTDNNIKLYETYIPRTIAYASNIAYEGKPFSLSNVLRRINDKKRITKENKANNDVYIKLMGEIFNG